MSYGRCFEKAVGLQTPIESTRGSHQRQRVSSRIYAKLCGVLVAAMMPLLCASSLWASQSGPNDDSCECQVVLSDFDSNEPFICPLFPAAQWRAYEGNGDNISLREVDCNDGAGVTRCSLKWTYQEIANWANLQLRLSGSDWNTPVDLSMYDTISFYIKGMEASTDSVKIKFHTTGFESEQRVEGAVFLDVTSQWDNKSVQLRGNSDLSDLDFRRTHTITFIDRAPRIAPHTVWINQVCLIPDPNSTRNDIIIENDKVAFKLTPGHGSLISVCDKDTGIELLSAGPLEWRLLYSLAYVSDTGERSWTNNCLAEEFSADLDPNGSRFSGKWIHKWSTTSGAEVLVTAELPIGSALATWTIDVNVTGDARLETLEFPVLRGVGNIGDSGEDDRLIYPCMGGRLYVNPIEGLRNNSGLAAYRYPSGLASMQLMGYYDNQTGFFVSSLDTRGLSKFPTWAPEGEDWATIKFTYDALSASGNGKSFEASARLGVFHGDWTTAASIYRE